MEALESLPTDLRAAYNKVFDRIADSGFAYRILGWIFHAQRILKMSELREALAIRIGSPSLDDLQTLQRDATEIVRICGGLVSHNKVSDLVTFSHETVKPFLENYKLANLPSQANLCKTCLTYLSLPPLDKPSQGEEYEERKKIFQFSDYAARFWATHAIQSKRNIEIETAILETFKSDKRREAMEELKFRYWRKRKSLLHVLIENRLTFIFMSPVLSEESVSRMYFLLFLKANGKLI